MDDIFKNEPNVLCYLDDIIVKSNTMQEHEQTLERVLLRLKGAGIVLNEKKCKFFCTKMIILDFIIENGTIKTDPQKQLLVKNFKRPDTVADSCDHSWDFAIIVEISYQNMQT